MPKSTPTVIRHISRGEIGADFRIDLNQCVIWIAGDLTPAQQFEVVCVAQRRMFRMSAQLLDLLESDPWMQRVT